MKIILTGEREEIWRWIRRQERLTGKKISFAGVIDDQGQRLIVIKEGTKENHPRVRAVRRIVEEEYPVFQDKLLEG